MAGYMVVRSEFGMIKRSAAAYQMLLFSKKAWSVLIDLSEN